MHLQLAVGWWPDDQDEDLGWEGSFLPRGPVGLHSASLDFFTWSSQGSKDQQTPMCKDIEVPSYIMLADVQLAKASHKVKGWKSTPCLTGRAAKSLCKGAGMWGRNRLLPLFAI